MSSRLAVILPLSIYFASAIAGGPVGRPPADTPSALHADARTAVARDAAAANAAVARLRAEGQAGLDALLAEHKDVLDRGTKDPLWPRVTKAIDKVAAQKDAFASRLYWYTDLEQAKAAARASGRPILSLHLLGRLDQDLSCANSRFFRTSLYADPKVSALLRENFVLHWESERPAPKITIDFGDGRKLERTVTGNSVHYVLDADGRPVDAIPGLAGAGMFRAELSEDAELEHSLRGLAPVERAARLSKHHALKRAVLNEEWPAFMVDASPSADAPPTALAAAPRAYSKMMAQIPTVRTLAPLEAAPAPEAYQTFESTPAFRALVEKHRAGAGLDPACVALMRLKEGPGSGAPRDEAAFARLVRTFEDAIMRDQVVNQYVLHARIHGWFAEEAAIAPKLAALDRRIYDQLFLTPASDPWLGLAPQDAYTAIDRGGYVPASQSR